MGIVAGNSGGQNGPGDVDGSDVNVVLWIRHFDAGFAELAIDGHVQVMDDRAAVVQIRQETSQSETERAFAERFQRNAWGRIVEHEGMFLFNQNCGGGFQGI